MCVNIYMGVCLRLVGSHVRSDWVVIFLMGSFGVIDPDRYFLFISHITLKGLYSVKYLLDIEFFSGLPVIN